MIIASLAWLAMVGPAQAQSASNGQVLYNKIVVTAQNTCAASACHGSAPSRRLNRIQFGVDAGTIKSAVNNIGDMRFLSGHLSDAEFNDLAAYIASSAGGTASYLPVSATPAATLSAGSIAFGSVTVGNSSALRTITLTNSGSAALSISALASSSASFALTHNCPLAPSSLAVGSACTLSVSFTPSVAGAASGNINLTTNATPANQSISMSGSGAAAAVALLAWSGSTSSLALASATAGSMGAAQTLTLLNQGSASATLSSISLIGANAGEFALGGSCAAGSSLAGNGNCTITVALDPSSAGTKTATLQVTASNASNPNTVSLSGSASAAATPPAGGGGTVTPAGATNANSGGGGCSLVDPKQADGNGKDRPVDPLLLVLAGLAACVLLWRRCTAGQATR